MVTDVDDWDPNKFQSITDIEHRIYGDRWCSIWAVVDYEDYLWARQYKWALKLLRGGKKGHLYRTGRDDNGRTKILYLHVEIMKRTGVEPPSDAHCAVDHRDGDTMHCKRANLRWAVIEG